VNRRFHTMAGKLQEEIEEQHVRTLETFVKNIQVKLVQRVSALEHNMREQSEAMLQVHEFNQRTEDNLSRLISGVDKLAHELPKRLAAAQASQVEAAGGPVAGKQEPRIVDVSAGEVPRESHRATGSQRSVKPARSWKNKKLAPAIFWSVVVLGLAGTGVYEFGSRKSDSPGKVPPMGKEVQTAAANAAGAAAKPAPVVSGDTKTKLDAAKQYMDRKEYTTAEDIYKQVVVEQPNNMDALRGLASVLYREDKIEESAAVLDRLPKN
jgi:hypothetical protein